MTELLLKILLLLNRKKAVVVLTPAYSGFFYVCITSFILINRHKNKHRRNTLFSDSVYYLFLCTKCNLPDLSYFCYCGKNKISLSQKETDCSTWCPVQRKWQAIWCFVSSILSKLLQSAETVYEKLFLLLLQFSLLSFLKPWYFCHYC